MPIPDVSLHDVYKARQKIAAIAVRTPLIHSPQLTELVGSSVYLKTENLQQTGSFKIRGATNKMLNLTDEEKARGTITISSGNHGRAVSYIAKRLGIHAVICMSSRVPSNKVEAISRLGAEVVVHGDSYQDAELHALQLQEERGLTLIDPFDDPFVIAGQGTIGLEVLEDLPKVDTILVPLSGGGLMSGIALAMKSVRPAIRVIGVSMDRAPVMYHSLKAGKPIDMKEEDTIADALVGNIGLNNKYTFRMVQQTVDDVVLVSDKEIAGAMVFALEAHHLVVEGGGSVGIAAILHQKATELGRNVVVVISGSNVGIPLLLKIAKRQQILKLVSVIRGLD
ncbi:MAG: hydroxyectoine utilization dehydratase EutB [Chloroflexi bacterium]|nr:hydroxyectoine utilization dehydratase EutB [Chloroflexota bacterium]